MTKQHSKVFDEKEVL